MKKLAIVAPLVGVSLSACADTITPTDSKVLAARRAKIIEYAKTIDIHDNREQEKVPTPPGYAYSLRLVHGYQLYDWCVNYVTGDPAFNRKDVYDPNYCGVTE